MKLPDLNVLIYAIDEGSPRHERARSWLEKTLSGTEAVGLTWSVLLGFVRITTNPVILEAPLEPSEALDYIDGWLAQPCVTVISPTEHHTSLLRAFLEPLGAAGNLTSDAHLAALAVEHGAELCSCDTDFARFEGLRWSDPLASF